MLPRRRSSSLGMTEVYGPYGSPASQIDVRAVIAFAGASAAEDLPAPSPIPPGMKVA